MSALIWFALGVASGILLTLLFALLGANKDLEDWHP